MSNTAMPALDREGNIQPTEWDEIEHLNRLAADKRQWDEEVKRRRAAAKAERREAGYIRYRRMLVGRCIVDCAAAAALYALDAMAGWATLLCACLSVINTVFRAKKNAASGN